jgi:hypothetical protein
VVTARELREEARVCRELAREIKDKPSIEMLRERADLLERRAAAIERRKRATTPDSDAGAAVDLASTRALHASIRRSSLPR